MTKKSKLRKTSSAPPARRAATNDYDRLLKAIESVNTQMVGRAAAVVNQSLVLRNWLIGAYLVEYEQGGADRAKYGAKLLERLADDLAKRGVKGLGRSILERCRVFFLMYPQIATAISETVSTQLLTALPVGDSVTTGYGIRQPAVAESKLGPALLRIPQPLVTESETPQVRKRIRGPVDPELGEAEISLPLVRKSADTVPTPLSAETVMRFSWTKLLEFTRIEDPWKRAFYENECLKGNWSKRQLQRQIESLLYERTGLSKNKLAVIQSARGQEPQETIEDLPEHSRPREKLREQGASALTDEELVAAILGMGTAGVDVRTIAKQVAGLIREHKEQLTLDHLLAVPGMGLAKAAQILSAFELARRHLLKDTIKILVARDVLPLVADIAGKPQEHFVCISLNGANEVIEKRVVTIGLLDQSPVHPREVFADVIADRAASVIFAHNHPSGDPQPSEADIRLQAQLTDAAKILGLRVLDHIIVTRKGHFSFQEAGLTS